ncbi:hypothetical protein EYR38_004989 [Pleurotus pulmonarius]|nr:hypothetical protein EYR38_004989 [Pleurotus pulmonarius]
MADPLRAVNPVYHPCIMEQRESTELVIFSSEIGRACEISFPAWRNGVRIEGIKEYLRRRNIFWSCFCALIECQPVSCRIVEALSNGETYTFCHYNPSRLVNIDKRRRTALLESTYPHIPTKDSGNPPDIDSLVVAFHLRHFADPDGPVVFEGYLGSYGARQLSGPELTRTPADHQPVYPRRKDLGKRSIKRIGNLSLIGRLILPPVNGREFSPDDPFSLPSSPISGTSQPVAGPSRLLNAENSSLPSSSTNAVNMLHPTTREATIIPQLLRAEGVAHYDWIGLVEECQKCHRHFVGSVLRAHIPQCTG